MKSLSEIELEYWISRHACVPAKDAKAIVERLVSEYGGIIAAARAVADRRGRSPATIDRSFDRWLTGKARMSPRIYDELWTML